MDDLFLNFSISCFQTVVDWGANDTMESQGLLITSPPDSVLDHSRRVK